MYQINVSTRRVTQYIIEEAYKWLYKKIVAGEYSVNKSKPAKALLLQIEEEQMINKENYNKFIELFENSPFSYMLYRHKRRSCNKITTDVIFNYFVEYNGHVLPLGFIKDFFEDDYETRREINLLLEEFGKSNKNEMAISLRRNLIDCENKLDEISASHQHTLKVHPMLIVTQLIQLILTGLYSYILVACINAIDLLKTLKTLMIDLKFDISDDIIASKTISAFKEAGDVFCKKADSFTFEEYLTNYWFYMLFCVVMIIILIKRLKNNISFIVYFVKTIAANIRICLQKLYVQKFEKNGLSDISEYFEEIIPDMAVSGYIDDNHSNGIPKVKNTYVRITKFDTGKISSKLDSIYDKFLKYKYTYHPDDIKIMKASWRKKMIVSIIFGVIFSFLFIDDLFAIIQPVISTVINYLSDVFEANL